MKTTTKLSLAFVAIGFIAALVGAFAIQSVSRSSQAEDGLRSASDGGARESAAMKADFLALRLSLREAAGVRALALRSAMDRELADLRSSLASDSEIDAYDALVSSWRIYYPIIERLTRVAEGFASVNFATEAAAAAAVESGIGALDRVRSARAADAARADKASVLAANRGIAAISALGLLASIACAFLLSRGLSRKLGAEPEELLATARDLAAGYMAPAKDAAGGDGARRELASATERVSAILRATRGLSNSVSATSRRMMVAAKYAAHGIDRDHPEEATWIEDVVESSRELSAQAAELRDAIGYFSFSPGPDLFARSPAPAMSRSGDPDEPREMAKAIIAAPIGHKRRPRLYLLPRARGDRPLEPTQNTKLWPEQPRLQLLKAGD